MEEGAIFFDWISQWPHIHNQFQDFVFKLKRGHVYGSNICAKITIELFKNMIANSRWTSAIQLINIVKKAGNELISAQPAELAIGSMVRRILFIVREEHENKAKQSKEVDLLAGVGIFSSSDLVDYSEVYSNLRTAILTSISELKDELDNIYPSICEHSLEHIHSDEIILTFGYSLAVERFLKHADNKKRKFHVIIAESAPLFTGQKMGKILSESGIDVTLIHDSSIFSVMPKVDKVIISTHIIMANGGLLAHIGGHLICLSAKENSIPVICVSGLFKLCPIFPNDQSLINLTSPSHILDYEEDVSDVDILNPLFDYIPPNLVDLYITNNGAHQSSFIYKLLSEYYHPDDYQL